VRSIRSRVGSALRRTGLIHVPPGVFTGQQLEQLQGMLAPVNARLDALAGTGPGADVLADYCPDAPSPQTALDIFDGEWASRFPPPLDGARTGTHELFHDPRLVWGDEVLGPIAGMRVLELGPLEGAHTYTLDRLGAHEVVAVEANRRAYLKCLVTKELLGIPTARFLCGDAVRHLEAELARGAESYDLVLASGVLYHLVDPVAALQLMTRISDRLLLWTMYYDEEVVGGSEVLSARFTGRTRQETAGFAHTLYRQEYREALEFRGFCGGSAASSAWLTRADVLGALHHFGFEIVATAFEERDVGGNGSAFCVAARRRGT
jgi:SAM-dependent methyltransferase